jgi:hypothetical protein
VGEGRVDVVEGHPSAKTVFSVQFGPEKLPSEHLAELRATGLTKLRVCSTRETAEMRATVQRRMDALTASRDAAGAEISGKGRVQEFNLSDPDDVEQFSMVGTDVLFAKLHSNPVMLHLLESFASCGVRAAHPPSTRITMPQDGTIGPGGGWHCDSKYTRTPPFVTCGV